VFELLCSVQQYKRLLLLAGAPQAHEENKASRRAERTAAADGGRDVLREVRLQHCLGCSAPQPLHARAFAAASELLKFFSLCFRLH
jgi:hypothetical protein